MNKIAEEIKSQGRKVSWVADQVGIPERTFRNYCSNKCQPSNATLKRVAELLNVTMEDLIE